MGSRLALFNNGETSRRNPGSNERNGNKCRDDFGPFHHRDWQIAFAYFVQPFKSAGGEFVRRRFPESKMEERISGKAIRTQPEVSRV